MNVIRHNYFHDQFNSILLYNSDRIGNYYDANVWIYRNRFENIVDDPYEPESFAFNNHFFNNTIIDAHRMVSFAVGGRGSLQGPVYVYNNLMLLSKDPTGEALSGRSNSAFKVELSSDYYKNGVFAFNNSVDVSSDGTNGFGIDTLSSTINNFSHLNNAYRTLKPMVDRSSLNLINSFLDFDMNSISLGFDEPNGFPDTDPQFIDAFAEDLRLLESSPARGKSKEIVANIGFTSPLIIPAGSDLGAFQYGATDFRSAPPPVYVVPPGGEDSSFPANVDWPEDTLGGENPPSGPNWLSPPDSTPSPSPQPLRGDANNDNVVDEVDYGIWFNHYLQSTFEGPTVGDFNSDGKVDGLDFAVWRNNVN